MESYFLRIDFNHLQYKYIHNTLLYIIIYWLNPETFSWQFVAFCLCSQSARQPEPIDVRADDDGHIFEFPTPPHNGSTSSKHIRECSAPQISVLVVEDKQMPEMPNLESVWANSLQNVREENFFCFFLCHWTLTKFIHIFLKLRHHATILAKITWIMQAESRSMKLSGSFGGCFDSP